MYLILLCFYKVACAAIRCIEPSAMLPVHQRLVFGRLNRSAAYETGYCGYFLRAGSRFFMISRALIRALPFLLCVAGTGFDVAGHSACECQ